MPTYSSAHSLTHSSTQLTTHSQRFQQVLAVMSLVAVIHVVFFPLLPSWLPHIPASGHAHMHAHGHPFIDARTLWGIPNAWDVLSNLPFLAVGVWGLMVLRGKALSQPLQRAAQVFFIGLIFTCLGSSYYHWAPDGFGLMIDRMGIAVAFAGVIALAAGSRFGAESSGRALPILLPLAMLAAVAAHSLNNVLPWVVVQFGGIALVLWLAYLPKRDELPLKLFALIGWYALAKVFEAQDEAVFEMTQGVISGHSLKHLAACMAAWPVIAALKT